MKKITFTITHEQTFTNDNEYSFVVKCQNNKIWYWNTKLFMCERFISNKLNK